MDYHQDQSSLPLALTKCIFFSNTFVCNTFLKSHFLSAGSSSESNFSSPWTSEKWNVTSKYMIARIEIVSKEEPITGKRLKRVRKENAGSFPVYWCTKMCNSDVLRPQKTHAKIACKDKMWGLLPKINAGQVVLNRFEPSPGSSKFFRWPEHLPGYIEKGFKAQWTYRTCSGFNNWSTSSFSG